MVKRESKKRNVKKYNQYADYLKAYYPSYVRKKKSYGGESPQQIGAALAQDAVSTVRKALAPPTKKK